MSVSSSLSFRRVAGMAVLGVTTALVGCGCGSTPRAGDAVTLPDVAVEFVTEDGHSAQDSDTIYAAVAELERRCMAEKGWPTRPRRATGRTAAEASVDSLENRRRFGYWIHEAAVKRNGGAQPGDGVPDAYDRWIQALPPKTLAQFEIDGTGRPETYRDFLIEGSGVTNAPTVGCSPDATRTIFGSLEASLRVSHIADLVVDEFRSRTEADPRRAAVLERWSACMTTAGRPARTPDDAKAELETAIARQGPTKELFAREVATAVADLNCDNEVGVKSTEHAISRDVARSLDAEKARLFMVAYDERSAALVKAKQVLADAGRPSAP